MLIINSLEGAERIKRVRVFMDWAIATSDRNGNKSLNSMIADDTHWIIQQARYAKDLEVHHDEFVNTAYDVLKKEEEKIKRYKAENIRLREALEEISEMYSDGKSPVLDHWGMLTIAKSALEETK